MMTLEDTDLGPLLLHHDPATDPFVVVGFQIGFPEVRAITRNRALADGIVDDTQFTGGRAVTVSLVLNDRRTCGVVSMQSLYDAVLPYMAPRRRPTLTWALPGSDVQRSFTVRGQNAVIDVNGPTHPGLVLQFLAIDEIVSPEQHCLDISPSDDVVGGRTYNLTFPRVYPASLGLGDRIVTNNGNERAHWTAVIYGAVTNPLIMFNGVELAWDVGAGLDLGVGHFLTVSSRDRTMYYDGNPTQSRYSLSNFTEWAWSDLLLDPGDNSLRFDGSVLGAGALLHFCWYDTWSS